jgi:tRNA pseudouridine13 synthase
MQVLPEEAAIGLETFFTKDEGIKGQLRTFPEDFVVVELAKDFPRNSEGQVTYAKVTSVNWETNHLINELSKQLHISRKRIMFAGTKDKRAKTTQILSFYRIKPEKVHQISLKDVEISDIFVSNRMLKLGDLKGNHFEITIRNLSETITTKQVDSLFSPIQVSGGFPNYFGIQRFGIIRPITHLVGKYMVLGDFKQAVMTYLTDVSPYEDEVATQVRTELRKTMDMKKAFHEFPDQLQFEKALAQHLTQDPDDYIGALKVLPRNLLTMFVYAYQSALFNKMLSHRIKQGIPLHQAIPGDVVLPVENDEITDREIPVADDNLLTVNKQLLKGRGFVSSVLVGSDTTCGKGVMGEIEQKVIETENVDQRDFIIPELPVASSYGARRALLSPVSNWSYDILEDEAYNGNKKLAVCFDLRKGCYATSFLREIMKTDDIRNY